MLASACAGPAWAGDAPIDVKDRDGAKAAEGKTVSVTGTPQRTRLAPSVDTGSFHVYCMNLPDWETTESVTVTGVLEHTSDYEAKTDVDGSHTAGTDGPVWVIRTCTVAKKP
ncbi:MAG: hypothetical protein GY898_01065 [Proteobacteria bacterium]|nr:hypothetical protein [Pseudomonadota bacterium]